MEPGRSRDTTQSVRAVPSGNHSIYEGSPASKLLCSLILRQYGSGVDIE